MEIERYRSGKFLGSSEGDMTPYELARLYWHRDEIVRSLSFDSMVRHSVCNGDYLLTGPKSFLLMKLVILDADLEKICNPLYVFDRERVNCVFIVQMAGNLSHGFRNVPKELRFGFPYVSALRRGKYVHWRYSDLDRLIHKLK